MTATARSREYLLERLNLEGPDLTGATTLLSKAGGDLIASLPALSSESANYSFASLSPDVITGGAGGAVLASRQLFAGLPARIRFARVPDGVNGSDTAHYLYISGGGGTAEAVLITGGAGVSGQLNGEITFTPANAHSGAWTIASASGGVAETMIANPNKNVQLPVGTTTFYAPVTVPSTCPGWGGYGNLRSIVGVQYITDSVIKVATTGNYFFRDFGIVPAVGSMTAGALIDVSAASNVVIKNMQWGGGGATAGYLGLRVSAGSSRIWVSDVAGNIDYRGLELVSVFAHLINIQIANGKDNTNYIAESCALYLKGMAGGFISNFISDAGAYAYGMVVDMTGVATNEVAVSGLYLDRGMLVGLYVKPGGGGVSGHWTVSNFRIVDGSGWFSVVSAGNAMELGDGCQNWHFANGTVSHGLRGINIEGAKNIGFSNVQVSPYEAGGGLVAVRIGSTGTPHDISFVGCRIGVAYEGSGVVSNVGFQNAEPTLVGLTLVGNTIDGSTQANKLVLEGTEVAPKIANNHGISNVRKTVAAANTTAFPVMDDEDCIEITGNTAMNTAVSGLREGQKITVIFTDATRPAISTVATIEAGAGFTPTRYKPYATIFTNGKWYIQ